jgi:hypothetical protein
MNSHPHRALTGLELAEQLQIKTRNLPTRLAEWTRLGLITPNQLWTAYVRAGRNGASGWCHGQSAV